MLSGSLIPSSIKHLNLGYSPVKYIGLFLGSNFHNEKDKNLIEITGKGINAAIGTYYFFHPERNRFFYSKKLKKVGALFYAKAGFTQSKTKNTSRSSRNKIREAIIRYQKYYWDFGLQLITVNSKIDFNYKYSQIYYQSATFIGDYRNDYTFAQAIERNLRNNSFFRDAELNIQVDHGKGYFNVTSGIVIFLPLKSNEPQIVYRRSRSFYLGFNINLHQLTAHLKKHRRLF